MATSDEELAKKAEEVERLRQQVAEAEALRESRERGLTNDIQAAELDAEAARLRAELAALKDSAKVSNVRESATPLLTETANAKEAASVAKAAEKAAGKDE